MAIVSHYAMRRYPVGPPEQHPTGGSSDFYTASNQKVNLSHDKCNKKTWGQRLKITKKEEQPEENFNQQLSQSSLSKSMKYAESWLYGTVRGVPSSPGHTFYGRMPPEMAVVICSCPEYLNGTKRDFKKASICKKCRGTRLSLTQIGGTVRVNSSPGLIGTMTYGNIGSVRVSNKSRPSILNNQNDPYDLMRRSRLLSPKLNSVNSNSKDTLRNRTKSSSPSRSRSRTRKRSQSPKENSIKEIRSRSASRSKTSHELWMEQVEPIPGGRRSILQYEVNPYDLISKNSGSEFSPVNDYDYELCFHSKKYENILNPLFNNADRNITNISGQRIRVSKDQSSDSDADNFAYEKIEIRNNENKTKERSISPKRPPRRKQDIHVEENESIETSLESGLALTRASLSHISTDTSFHQNNNNNSIKSILKRPSSFDSSDNEWDVQSCIKLLDVIPTTPLKTVNVTVGTINNKNDILDNNCKKINKDQEKTVSGSHFYLPLPQRKKVQFLVENETVSNDTTTNDTTNIIKIPSTFTNDAAADIEAIKTIKIDENTNSLSDENLIGCSDEVIVAKTKIECKSVKEGVKEDYGPIKRTILRRSFSERRTNKSNIKAKFHDTTALRTKQNRVDARNLFNEDLPTRPTEPPPPPPILNNMQNFKMEKVTIKTYDDENIYEDFTPSVIVIQNDLNDEKKSLQRQIEAYQGSRVFGNVNKTVVKVNPLMINRLEIRSNDDDYETCGQKKTSIMISGDDCYSTVNANDDTPIYQSSVVVNDDVMTSPGILNSSNTITISVCSPPTTPEQETIFKNNKNNLMSNSIKSIRGCTLISLDYDEVTKHETEINNLLRDPVEAVKLNLIPHVCGKDVEPIETDSELVVRRVKHKDYDFARHSFVTKLLEDPTLRHLADGLDNNIIVKLIENSLIRLKDVRSNLDMSGTKDEEDMSKLIEATLQKIQEERQKMETKKSELEDHQSIRDSISSGNSFSSANYELFDFDNTVDSDCYQSCSSELTAEEDGSTTRSKFYQMLVDATLSEIEISTTDDDHHYESIRLNGDPIYEEISEIPPPLPLTAPPLNCSDIEQEKRNARSMFEGASKYDILSYLVDAKERGLVPEETYAYNFSNTSDIIIEEQTDLKIKEINETNEAALMNKKSLIDIERNDSGVGSETSKTSRSKFQDKSCPIHLCEDCDGGVETKVSDSGVMFAPLVCRKCGKKRAERKEIITEVVETEEKYGRDLQIILEEFYQPMLVAGLLTQDQLSAIFLNTEELLENNQTLAERMRDALDIATEQGDDDLLTVNVGRLFIEAAPTLHAFESYCVRQASASLLLANLEKEKELLRIFLRVSQMENTVLRRMNLNSFLMVPVQRVTKYPLLLARLYKVTPLHLEGRDSLKQAQEKIELHLNHMNRETKDIPTKLWRRISSSSPGRRLTCEVDMINIKLRKMAVDLLEWNHDAVRFAMEGKLLFTQPTDNNWRKGRTIKLTPVNALLVTNGKPSSNYKADRALEEQINFSKHTGIREACLLLVKEKCGRYTLFREPLYLDRCITCTETDWEDYFEVQEVLSKDTFIFKAEDGNRTKSWYTQLQYHSQGMGSWRKRRNALANIMINGMMTRT